MAIRTILFLIGCLVCAGGSFYHPIFGVVGYVCHYLTWPEEQWWGNVLNPYGVRFSLMFGLLTAVGMVVSARRLRMGRRLMVPQEWLMLLFLCTAVLTNQLNALNTDLYPTGDWAALMAKLTKIFIFTWMLTHVVTDLRRYRVFVWTLILCTLYLGFEAYTAPIERFQHSRLNRIGGPDFSESSFFGAHLAAVMPFIGVAFLTGNWWRRLFCTAAAAFTINALILTRTRAAIVGCLVGLLAALILRLRRRKLQLIACLIPTLVAGVLLTDAGFRTRIGTIFAPPEERDQSVVSRLQIWHAAVDMLMNHPLGVGAGNFAWAISRYNRNLYARDAHNTFVRTAGELGVHSLLLHLAVIACAALTLRAAMRCARGTPAALELHYHAYALMLANIIMLACGMFMSQTYIEEYWWFLAMPVCVFRCAENARRDWEGETAHVAFARPGWIAASRSGASRPARAVSSAGLPGRVQ